jgi:hypothetical protein
LGYFREIIIDLFVYSSAQKRKCLYEPFGMGILTFIGLKQQPAGNLGVLPGKFSPHFSDNRQFLFIII